LVNTTNIENDAASGIIAERAIFFGANNPQLQMFINQTIRV
jgi:hypothetical protein